MGFHARTLVFYKFDKTISTLEVHPWLGGKLIIASEEHNLDNELLVLHVVPEDQVSYLGENHHGLLIKYDQGCSQKHRDESLPITDPKLQEDGVFLLIPEVIPIEDLKGVEFE